MPAINHLVEDTGSPPIPQVQAWGRDYAGGRGPLIDLCQAVPGYAPHPELIARLAAATGDPATTRYGAILGDPPLREAYAAHVSGVYDVPVPADRVVITAGCNQAFFATMLTLVERGGSVLLPTPWYYNHEMTCRMLGLGVRALPCTAANGFVPDPEAAAALLGDDVRAIVLVTPNNPTGAIYPPEIIERFRTMARERGVWLVLDETYRDFLPMGAGRPHAALAEEDGVVQLYSFSKAYAVPGARLGALVAPSSLIPHYVKVMDCLHICPNRVAQAALGWAIGALAGWRAENRAEMDRRASVVRDGFAALPGWRISSQGAYFAYLRHPFAGLDAWDVVRALAQEHGVVMLPAPAFAGGGDHLRLSFGNIDIAGIRTMLTRLANVSVPQAA